MNYLAVFDGDNGTKAVVVSLSGARNSAMNLVFQNGDIRIG
jgi:phage gp45-like